jgi:LytS/YehU family sensor histidine kinase
LRFADKFQYSIDIQDDIPLEQYRVPAMLLQPHVENAIRHGLIPAEKNDNYLHIKVKGVENGLICIIEDNGIGRKRSLELKKFRSTDHRSMGSKISKERLEMIRSLKLGNITEEIDDIVDNNGKVVGTIVKILLLNINSVSLSD